MRSFFRLMGKVLGFALVLLVLVGTAFAQLSPELGGTPTAAQRQAYQQSGHVRDGQFFNPQPTVTMTGGSTLSALWRGLFANTPNQAPAAPLPTQPLDSLSITRKAPGLVRVTWLGHSASLVEIGGKNGLLDPMLSVKMGPLPWLAPKRYNPSLAIPPSSCPPSTPCSFPTTTTATSISRPSEKLRGRSGISTCRWAWGPTCGPGACQPADRNDVGGLGTPAGPGD